MIRSFCSFAKINLFLYVVSRRKDGYHNLYSLMTRINLFDDIELDFSSDRFQVSCDHPHVPLDNTNLVLKAARAFFAAAGDRIGPRGLSVKIVKRIPPGGGLGGGSSNAATVLTALNEFHHRLFSDTKLRQIGVGLGADVPFFINGSPAIARGVGDALEPVDNLVPYHLLLCDPGVAASTADVYKNIDFRLTENQKYTMNTGLNVPIRGQRFDVRGLLHNDLEESACRLYPGIKKTKEEMAFLLQRNVHMTGSGSSLFALYSDREKAQDGYETLAGKWSGSRKKVFLSAFK